MAGIQTISTTPTNNNPATMKQKAPMASRLQSPPASCFLGSNDDQLERAQARAARAAAIRRKSIINPPRPSHQEDILGRDQIIELFQNCIKLASENKINQKNTWDLSLIDHLSDIIKVEEEDAETNFQKASCTLEAGVKIYSLRVDSVHSEAYKVLGGINRAGCEEKETPVDGDHIGRAEEDGGSKKESEKKLSPLLTLESSFEALNIKKFDVAFTVDPLYHQTSAQFDEGGAKGLLLNNLGVYGGCRVLFDSLEFPGKSISSAILPENSQVIDISFARDCIEQMMINLPTKNDISPTLREIVKQFDEDNQRPSEMFFAHNQAVEHDIHGDDHHAEVEANGFDDTGPWSFDQENQTSSIDDCSTYSNPSAPSHHDDEFDSHSTFYEAGDDDRQETMAYSLFIGLGFPSKSNAWAGPDHWKYRKAKGPDQVPVSGSESLLATKKSKNRKQEAFSIDFTSCLEMDSPDIFLPPKNPKSLLLPVNSSPSNTTLPEDCHYKPEDLVKLFLLPHIMCIGKKGKLSPGDSGNQSNSYEPLASWDNGSENSCQFDDGNAFHSDVEDSSNLVSQPRQVNKIEVQYDKSSKQVDVHALKGTLWDCIQDSLQMSEKGCEGTTPILFRHLLANFPEDCPAAASAKDISPHLCFICLLHLANEHCLSIRSCEDLDELYIYHPQQITERRG